MNEDKNESELKRYCRVNYDSVLTCKVSGDKEYNLIISEYPQIGWRKQVLVGYNVITGEFKYIIISDIRDSGFNFDAIVLNNDEITEASAFLVVKGLTRQRGQK